MKTIQFHVVEGVDKGRVYRDLPVPVSIGREEGNVLRLNDERVSRFHAKIQYDGEDVIITDLESTNGTRINGDPVQIRRLQAGDRIGVGRSVLVFGSAEEIKNRVARLRSSTRPAVVTQSITIPEAAALTDAAAVLLDPHEAPLSDKFWANVQHPPALPSKLHPAQAARLTEILDFMHRGIASAADSVRIGAQGEHVSLPLSDWLKIQAVQTLLAHYARAVSDPGEADE
ncbi:MAG: FHA domain-containing protein [Gemmataceae bacterium]|nr:FHA domain-containing protein [Gemmataceae bacterium]